jgi:tripartite-type tricarboxylate transporter receptor subunit TctC
MRNKILILTLVLLSIGIGAATVNGAGDYPVKAIEILVPYTPGSTMDIMARIIAEIGPKYTGQPWVVVNKPGAGGSLAAAELISSKPDGYRLITLANIFFSSTTKTQKVPFDPDNLGPIANFMEFRLALLVKGDSPWKTLSDLINYAKNNPGQLKWSHTGRGISLHIGALNVFRKAGVQTIDVPFKGTPEAVSALLGGHVDAASVAYSTTRDHVMAGKLRCLTFYTDRRYPDLPDVPSVAELGFPDAAKLSTFVGLYAHKGTPENIRKYLSEVSKKIYDDPRFKKLSDTSGEEPRFGGPEFMRDSIRKSEEVTVPILKELGLYVGK